MANVLVCPYCHEVPPFHRPDCERLRDEWAKKIVMQDARQMPHTSRASLRWATEAVDWPANDSPLDGKLNVVLVYADGTTTGYLQILGGTIEEMMTMSAEELAKRYWEPLAAALRQDLQR